ncbi:MAG TPA: twin-arginine translocase TatA/TatE family subunit [Chloroflexi bacterium]|nr:twin-arginine translocase TatA/TatE family subunit [Chloroflexota bacterium]
MLFRNLGVPELILILVIAILIFGPGRIGKIGAELGKGIRGFKEGVSAGDSEKEEPEEETSEGTQEETTEEQENA